MSRSKMHSSLGFLNVLLSHMDIVRVNQYHSYRKILARATLQVLSVSLSLVRENPFLQFVHT